MAESTAKCEISQEHLECPICLRLFKDPKTLDCLHSFCQSCLEDLVSKYQPDADKIICPVCRKTTDIPDSRCENLRSCFFLSSLVDDVNKRDKLIRETSVSNVICEECEDGLEAISRCLDCNGNICQQCEAAHKRWKHTKKHRIVSDLTPSPSQEVTAKDPRSPKCRQHPDHDLSLYCETCKILICFKCGVTDHRSAEHILNDIADAVGSHRKDVDDVMKKFQMSEKEFKVLQESISHSRKRLKLMVTNACDDVSAKEKEEIAKIQTKAQLLRDEITKIGKDRDEEYEKVFNSNRDKMERAMATVAAVNDLMKHADDFEVLDFKPKVMHNLEFQKELLFEHGKHRMSFIDVKCQDVVPDTDLGGILYEEKWVLKEMIPSHGTRPVFRAHNVGGMQNGDIAVFNRDAAAISVFTSNGRFKTSLNREGGLQKPWAMTVTQDDLMLVTDGEFVKVFNTDQQLISQFRPAQNESGELRESKLKVIATDAQNRVAVADRERRVIYVTNLDGSLISVIPTSVFPFGIAFQHDNRLVLSDYYASRLLCLDFASDEVFSVSTEINGQLMEPWGVCCDEAGDIYVNLRPPHDTGGNSEVHQYTAHGVHVQCIAQGLFWPFDVTFSRLGELLVADYNSVKIFSRV